MSRFHTTRWSLVIDARGASDSSARALDQLCRVYRPPVLAYVRRFSGGEAEAQDLTQAFFEQLLRQRTYDAADPQRGRFRVFLLVALKRFLLKQVAAARTTKRGGGQVFLSLDCQAVAGSVPVDPDNPDAAFERGWAQVVVHQAISRLQEEAAAGDKLDLFRPCKVSCWNLRRRRTTRNWRLLWDCAAILWPSRSIECASACVNSCAQN